MTTADNFITTLVKELIVYDPMKRQEFIVEWTKKLEDREWEVKDTATDKYEFTKELILRQVEYQQNMQISDTKHNEGQRDEAERTLHWLQDIAATEFEASPIYNIAGNSEILGEV